MQLLVVPNIKDINFWEQFTTLRLGVLSSIPLFRISKISTFESNSQQHFRHWTQALVVPNIKDINFWEQFTTRLCQRIKSNRLFRISKISTFESNSQPKLYYSLLIVCCSEYQRYQLLRAIHNRTSSCSIISLLFRISKISTFESNSQQDLQLFDNFVVVPNIKDINFWEQFTTNSSCSIISFMLFRISKISTFESNSQLLIKCLSAYGRCSEYQRYQLLRAIHNCFGWQISYSWVVPNIKDINFWEQFTTLLKLQHLRLRLFRISKISTFESNSQHR